MNVPLPIVCSLIGLVGVFLGFGLNELKKTGKTKLDEANAQVHYKNYNGKWVVTQFTLHLQFENKSEYQRIIKIGKINYFDGENSYPVFVDDYTLTPADMVPNKSIKCLKFKILTAQDVMIAPLPHDDDNI